MNQKMIKYVQARPVTGKNGTIYFESNVKPGDIVLFKKGIALQPTSLHKPATVISETPFHILIDLGMFKVSVSKASIYVKDEILYFLP